MTEWIDIEKFKKRKGEVYAFYHPPEVNSYSKSVHGAWVMVDSSLPSHPRKPTLYAVLKLPLHQPKEQ